MECYWGTIRTGYGSGGVASRVGGRLSGGGVENGDSQRGNRDAVAEERRKEGGDCASRGKLSKELVSDVGCLPFVARWMAGNGGCMDFGAVEDGEAAPEEELGCFYDDSGEGQETDPAPGEDEYEGPLAAHT